MFRGHALHAEGKECMRKFITRILIKRAKFILPSSDITPPPGAKTILLWRGRRIWLLEVCILEAQHSCPLQGNLTCVEIQSVLGFSMHLFRKVWTIIDFTDLFP